MTEIYVSTDVEADGPIPGCSSLLSFGSAAFRADGTMVGTYTANLATLPGASADPETMAWWAGNPEAWQACRSDLREPGEAMTEYRGWLEALPGRPVFVGYPAAYDFMFIYWYLVRFTGGSPFSHSALDLKSYAMAVLGGSFRGTTKRTMPRDWFGPARHTHVALDDAIEQGHLWLAMRRAADARAAG
ncbi:exonuclease [Micromonospora sp. WMMD987]|uniref:exonuclease n=1 Tax=Micromonospora sp. WMMD987 TaxID=3016089 RepID=UPI00249A2734|nr:exonuclease [Micromonospora sp. WMMD987]WFE94692.1 exonuclease [Micromonospora sp. WMMD987]